MVFSDFLTEIQQKTFKTFEKNSVKSYSLKLVDMRMLVDSQGEYLKIAFFWLIFNKYQV